MLNWTSGVSRSLSRWTFQVSASLGATLIAALVVQALPRSGPDLPTPALELTSGGKFAARVASARAYDGLDTMPLPHLEASALERPPLIPAAFLATSPNDLSGFGATVPPSAGEGTGARDRAKAPRVSRIPSRAEARRLRAPAEAPAPVETRDAPQPAAAAASDDGLLHAVVAGTRQVWSGTSATTRDAWSATASVGSSLVSHLLP